MSGPLHPPPVPMHSPVRLFDPPPVRGILRITADFAIYSTDYPNWFWRFVQRTLLGWKWERM